MTLVYKVECEILALQEVFGETKTLENVLGIADFDIVRTILTM